MRHTGEMPAERQRRHWQDTYTTHPGMYGPRPSDAAVHAADVFAKQGAARVAELGAGHGRDTLYLAGRGFTVEAVDFSAIGVEQLCAAAEQAGLGDRVQASVHDVRTPLPWPDASLDGVFAHMLLCMALSTQEIVTLVAEVEWVLRPGGAFVYTVRHTGDAHYGSGIAHGDDISSTAGSRCTSSTAHWSTAWPLAGSSLTCTPSPRASCRGGCGASRRCGQAGRREGQDGPRRAGQRPGASAPGVSAGGAR